MVKITRGRSPNGDRLSRSGARPTAAGIPGVGEKPTPLPGLVGPAVAEAAKVVLAAAYESRLANSSGQLACGPWLELGGGAGSRFGVSLAPGVGIPLRHRLCCKDEIKKKTCAVSFAPTEYVLEQPWWGLKCSIFPNRGVERKNARNTDTGG